MVYYLIFLLYSLFCILMISISDWVWMRFLFFSWMRSLFSSFYSLILVISFLNKSRPNLFFIVRYDPKTFFFSYISTYYIFCGFKHLHFISAHGSELPWFIFPVLFIFVVFKYKLYYFFALSEIKSMLL